MLVPFLSFFFCLAPSPLICPVVLRWVPGTGVLYTPFLPPFLTLFSASLRELIFLGWMYVLINWFFTSTQLFYRVMCIHPDPHFDSVGCSMGSHLDRGIFS